MRKKLLMIAFALLVVGIGAVFLWPLSFDGFVSADVDTFVSHVAMHIEDGAPSNETTTYTCSPQSKEAKRIGEILSNYTFHRVPGTFFGNAALEGNDAGYFLQLYSGENHLLMGGTGKAVVNGKVYHIGYFGNEKSLSLMQEVLNVLLGFDQ